MVASNVHQELSGGLFV